MTGIARDCTDAKNDFTETGMTSQNSSTIYFCLYLMVSFTLNNSDIIVHTLFILFISYWQGGEFIEFLQNKYLPTLQLAPGLIQVSINVTIPHGNSKRRM